MFKQVIEAQNTTSGYRQWLAVGGGVLVGAALGYLVFFGLPESNPSTDLEPDPPPDEFTQAPRIALAGLETGAEAPGFQLDTPDGASLDLTDYRGEIVLLNFWATWCAPCRTEMPLLQETFDQLSDQGFVVLGIDFDESADAVSAFREELGLSFPLLLDPGGKIQQLYKVRGYPTTVVLDREGRIHTYHIGVLIESQLEGYLEAAGLDP